MSDSYIKDFDHWNSTKKNLDRAQRFPTFKEREIWWCSVGINIGHESDGKNELYHRPVLIIKKFNKRLFWGIPTTSKAKPDGHPMFYPITFQGKRSTPVKMWMMLSHLRLYDCKRLNDMFGKLSPKQFQKIKQAVKGLL